jgi:hypothetical protein
MSNIHVLIAHSALRDQIVLALDEIENILSDIPFITMVIDAVKAQIPKTISKEMAVELSKMDVKTRTRDQLFATVERLQSILVPNTPALSKKWHESIKISDANIDMLCEFMETVIELSTNYVEKLNEH